MYVGLVSFLSQDRIYNHNNTYNIHKKEEKERKTNNNNGKLLYLFILSLKESENMEKNI